MRRPLTEVTEVVGSCHQARAEDPVPNAIHKHARGQRIIRAAHHVRQGQATASLPAWHRAFAQHRKSPARNRLAKVFIHAAPVYVIIHAGVHVHHAIQGVVLADYKTFKELVEKTRTDTGLKVNVRFLDKHFAAGIKTDKEKIDLSRILKHPKIPELSYRIAA